MVGDSAGEAAYAVRRSPGAAGMADPAKSVGSQAGAVATPERFYSWELDPARSTPASASDVGAKVATAADAACKGARSATPTTP